MKNNEKLNEQLQVTWKIAGRIWLAWAWRLTIFGVIFGYLLSGIKTIFLGTIGSGPGTEALFWVIWAPVNIYLSILILKRILRKHYARTDPHFRVLIVKSEPTKIQELGLDEDEGPLTHDQKILKKQLSEQERRK